MQEAWSRAEHICSPRALGLFGGRLERGWETNSSQGKLIIYPPFSSPGNLKRLENGDCEKRI